MGRKAGEMKIAILVASGFSQAELTECRKALDEASLHSTLVSPEPDKVLSWNDDDWGDEFEVGLCLEQASAADFDVLFMPGNVMNPEVLRNDQQVIDFVCSFFEAGKPVAALCRGPWILINAGIARGEAVNSYHSMRTDLRGFIHKMVQQIEEQASSLDLPSLTDDGTAPDRKARESRPAFKVEPPRLGRLQMFLWQNKGRRPSPTPRRRVVRELPSSRCPPGSFRPEAPEEA